MSETSFDADCRPSRPTGATLWRVDAYVRRFDKAWQDGGCPAIKDFLPSDGHDRLAVLNELIHVDWERRLRAGMRLPVAARQIIARIGAGGLRMDLVHLYDAVNKLAKHDRLKAQLVALRVFAGMTLPEAAVRLDMAPSAANRAWRYARAWLYAAMDGDCKN